MHQILSSSILKCLEHYGDVHVMIAMLKTEKKNILKVLKTNKHAFLLIVLYLFSTLLTCWKHGWLMATSST